MARPDKFARIAPMMSAAVIQTAVKRPAVEGRDDVFLLDHFLSPEECERWIAFAECEGFEEAAITTGAGQVIAKDVRNNDRLLFDDEALAAEWWPRVQPFVPPTFGRWRANCLNERFRCYRYGPGQRFVQHYDGSYQRSKDENSWLTLMVYLNDDFSGGTTRFDLADLAEPLIVTPRSGTALVFMHHRLHSGDEVSAGRKYVLRTDVMYRRGQPE